MWLLTKELALAVVESHMTADNCGELECSHCQAQRSFDWEKCEPVCEHTPECIVTRAKLLLDVEYGVKSKP